MIVLLLAVAAGRACAQATAASQTNPENKVDFGAGAVSNGSYKFGEYNGLENSGPFGIGNVDLTGGAKYDSNNTWRWHLEGRNLGLENRSIRADFGKQGKYRFFVAYSELLANRSDTYATPYLGAGTGNFTLPTNWLFPSLAQRGATSQNFRVFDATAAAGSYYNSSGVLTAPTSAQLAANAAILAADVPDFQNVSLHTKRTRVDAGVNLTPSTAIDVPLGISYEHKSGRKALGAVTSQVVENSVTLPIPIDFDTTQADAGLKIRYKRLLLSFGYYASIFKDNVSSVTWQDVADPTKSATMATAPSNQFHQFTFVGSEKFRDTMKLLVAGSYGRNTQNDAFLGPSTAANGQLAFGLPATSLKGLVVNSMISAKFTAKPAKKANLVAAYKYFNRDNQTPVNTYLFQDVNESKSGTSAFAGLNGLPATLGSNTNIYQNRSYSQMLNQADGSVEYEFAKKQWIEATYQWQKVDRSCNGAWIDCSDAAHTNEHTIGADWRTTSAGSFTGRVDYAASWRRGAYNENAFLALVPAANMIPAGGATMSAFAYMQQAGITGFGPVAGLPGTALTGNAAIFTPNNNIVPQGLYGSRNNINELPGMRRYMESDRNTQKVWTNLDWQASDKISLHGNGQYKLDDYLHSVYGLIKDAFWEASLDASYTVGDNFTVDVFYTYDNHRYLAKGDAYGSNSTTAFVGQAANTVVTGGCFATVALRNASGKIDPCLNFQKNDRDKIDTLGMTIGRKNLLAGKLELASQILYTRARTDNAVAGGSYVNNPLALAAPAPALPSGTAATYYIAAQNYPTVRDDQITVTPTAQYSIDKRFTLKAFYMFQRMMSSDWGNQGMQYGTGTNYLPTTEKAPNYAVNAGGLSMVWAF